MSEAADSRSDDFGERVIRNEERLTRLDESVDLRFKSRDEALRKQAKEYGRRLSDLNHENARVAAAQDASVSLDKFEGFVNANDEWRSRVDAFMVANATTAETSDKNRRQLQATILVCFAAATIILSFVVAIANGRL